MKHLLFSTIAILVGFSAQTFAQNQDCDSSANVNKICVKNGAMGVCTSDIQCEVPQPCNAQNYQKFCVYIDRTPKTVTYFRGICSTDLKGYACVPQNDVNGDAIYATPLELGVRE